LLVLFITFLNVEEWGAFLVASAFGLDFFMNKGAFLERHKV
jgi:hypothetical protein